jgi:hypothetical protein
MAYCTFWKLAPASKFVVSAPIVPTVDVAAFAPQFVNMNDAAVFVLNAVNPPAEFSGIEALPSAVETWPIPKAVTVVNDAVLTTTVIALDIFDE